MQLYVTYGSPYARLARIVVVEKGLEDRVEIIEAKTRMKDSPYYQINPSGRVPYLVDDTGVGMEDSQLICAYLDSLDGKPRLHDPLLENDWAYRRTRGERAQHVRRHLCMGAPNASARMRAFADRPCSRGRAQPAHGELFRGRVPDPPMQGTPRMAHLILAVSVDIARKRGLGDLTAGRPQLATWVSRISDLPGMRATALP